MIVPVKDRCPLCGKPYMRGDARQQSRDCCPDCRRGARVHPDTIHPEPEAVGRGRVQTMLDEEDENDL